MQDEENSMTRRFARCRRRRRAWADPRGQATTETIMIMMFLLFLVCGFFQMSMLATTKYMVNLAAFSAARTQMVDNSFISKTGAACTAMEYVDWWRDTPIPCVGRDLKVVTSSTRTIRGKNRSGLLVTHLVPFGLPIMTTLPPLPPPLNFDVPFIGVMIRSFSSAIGPDSQVQDTGDNAGT